MLLLHHGMFMGPLFLFGQLFWILILALLIGALVRMFSHRRHWYYNRPPFYQQGMEPGPWRHSMPKGMPPVPPVPPVQLSAMEILRQRYARGEIDGATFDQMRERLEASHKPDQQ